MPMIPAFSHRTGLLLLPVFVLVLALALPLFAVDGRDFAGFYALSNVADRATKFNFACRFNSPTSPPATSRARSWRS